MTEEKRSGRVRFVLVEVQYVKRPHQKQWGEGDSAPGIARMAQNDEEQSLKRSAAVGLLQLWPSCKLASIDKPMQILTYSALHKWSLIHTHDCHGRTRGATVGSPASGTAALTAWNFTRFTSIRFFLFCELGIVFKLLPGLKLKLGSWCPSSICSSSVVNEPRLVSDKKCGSLIFRARKPARHQPLQTELKGP